MTNEQAGTRERALEAAEQLFVAHGYDGTSLRAIATLANVNLGSLVYYFATKERLFRALCEERLSRIIAVQAAALKACEARLDAGEPVTLEEVLRGLVAPSLPGGHAPGELRGLYARLFTDPSEAVVKIGKALFFETSQLTYRLARRLLPQLDEAEFHWRYVGALGALVITQSFAERIAALTNASPPTLPPDQLSETITGVIARGLGGGMPG